MLGMLEGSIRHGGTMVEEKKRMFVQFANEAS